MEHLLRIIAEIFFPSYIAVSIKPSRMLLLVSVSFSFKALTKSGIIKDIVDYHNKMNNDFQNMQRYSRSAQSIPFSREIH